MHWQHRATSSRPRRSRAASCACSATPRRSSRRRRRASAWCASLPAARRARGDDELAREAEAPARVRADRVPGRRARRRGRRRLVPAPRRRYHPTCHSLRLLHVGDRPLRLLRAVQRHRPRRARRGAQECCGFGGTFAVKNADTSMAMLSDKLRHVLDTRAEVCTSADNSCLMHIGGALRRQRAGVRTRAPRRDPGGAGMTQAASPAAARETRCATPSCAATSARRRRRSAPSARAAVAELPDWEALRDGRRGDQGARDGDAARAARAARGVGARARAAIVHWARDGAEANAIVARHRARPTARDEVIKVKSLATDEIGLNDALAARGHRRDRDRPRRADHPARRRHVVAHPRAGDPQEPRRDPRAVRAHDRAGARTSADEAEGARRGRARAPAREVPLACRWRSAARTSASPRPARSASSSPRATGACARRCREVLVTVMGIEKVVPEWRDLEVFLQLLPRSSTAERMNPYTSLWTGVRPGDGPRGVPPRPARQRPHRRAGRRGRPPGAALHPLLGVPERLPGLLAHRRAGVRVGLSGPDRGDPDAAAARARPGADAAVGLVAVRRLLRGVPGARSTSRGARPPARPRRARGRGARAAREGWRCRRVGARLRARAGATSGAEARAARPRAARRPGGGAPGLGAWTQMRDLPEVPAQTLPRLVARAQRGDRRVRRRRAGSARDGARDAVLRRIRDALGPAPAAPEPSRAYRQAGGRSTSTRSSASASVVADYDATVHRVAARRPRGRAGRVLPRARRRADRGAARAAVARRRRRARRRRPAARRRATSTRSTAS